MIERLEVGLPVRKCRRVAPEKRRSWCILHRCSSSDLHNARHGRARLLIELVRALARSLQGPSEPPTVGFEMMMRFLPWKFLMKRAARRYGVLDPASLLAKIRSFAQPSEVAEPMELLRAGIVFHARGLVNVKAIQHNLDWVWPYWVEKQFDPGSTSFIPRAFSFSHINLTHRNWTAVGFPDLPAYPLVDPRGLVTPLHDGWSLDFWMISKSSKRLLPSRLSEEQVTQELIVNPQLEVVTCCEIDWGNLELRTWLEQTDSGYVTKTSLTASSHEEGWLVVAVRPYNPEGVQFIETIAALDDRSEFRVNREATVNFSEKPEAVRLAHYAEGDVYLRFSEATRGGMVSCDVGMATGAALFPMSAATPKHLEVCVSMERDLPNTELTSRSWFEALRGTASLSIPDQRMRFLYDAAVRTLILLSADDLVPGPYTYRRFWFRDACLMLHPLMLIGQIDRAERVIASFPKRQTVFGYFLSQEGEWDSNGQVLWALSRFAELTGKQLAEPLNDALKKGVRWLSKKRTPAGGRAGTEGLLPAGFSAEHFGPNDFYYWDDYWAVGGLQELAKYWQRIGESDSARVAQELAASYTASLEASLQTNPERWTQGAIPAAPGRRMDAGAIGSMVADYPLQLYPPADPRMLKTAEFLMSECSFEDAFFQEIIHSGMNAYLTLDLAQTLLRAGDERFAKLIRRVAELASPTGQWPEAIHPQTLGGCMGDGQHGWAAAEWIMMIRNCFVREEHDCLILGSGILPEWQTPDCPISFGPSLTRWGDISVSLINNQLQWVANWRELPPSMVVAVPGYQRQTVSPELSSIHLES